MRRLCLLLLFIVTCLPLSGCGGCGGVSASNMKRYSRKRTPDIPDGDLTAVAKTPAAKDAGQKGKAVVAQPMTAQPADKGAANPATTAKTPVELPVEPSTEPEAKPVTETERRARSIANLEKIGKALVAYAAKHGKLPPHAETIDTEHFLSWRVLILPELGYPELYARFRRGEMWDSPHNKLLLDYIPREYQSPERFDVKTNYQTLAGFGMAFYATDGMPIKEIKDGAGNTLAVVEVDDKFAQEWTRPIDHVPTLEQPHERLGALRGEGAFGLLANGRVVLLPRDLAASRMAALFTAAGGEPLDAAHTFLKPPTAEPPPPTLATTADDPTSANLTPPTPTEQSPAEGPTSAATPVVAAPVLGGLYAPDLQKKPVPDEQTLAKSRELLKQLYGKDYEAARTRQERQQFLTKLMADVPNVEENPADLYELARIARDVAVALGDANAALAACDLLEQRFQIDPLPLRLKVLQDLQKQPSNSDVGGAALTEAQRVERLALDADRFDVAIPAHESALVFARIKELDKSELSRLQQQGDELDAAKSLFIAAERALATLKDQPSDALANEAVGRYLCFVKDRWDAGLPYLARASDIKLRGIASMEMSADRTVPTVLALADQYWDLAGRMKPPQRRGLHLRAIYCYELIGASLTGGLEKVKANKRLAEAVTMYGQAEIDRVLAPLRALQPARPAG